MRQRRVKGSWWGLWLGVALLLLASGVRASTLPGFYVEFVDGNDADNLVSFTAVFANADSRTYWVGIAPPDHSWISSGLAISANSSLTQSFDLSPGTYDIYVAWDTSGDSNPDTYVWTSQPGMATYAINESDPSPSLSIAWQNGIDFSQFQFSFSGDGFGVHAVPLPAAAGLLSLGLFGVGVVRRRSRRTPGKVR